MNEQANVGDNSVCPYCGFDEIKKINHNFLVFAVAAFTIFSFTNLQSAVLEIVFGGLVVLITFSLKAKFKCKSCGESWMKGREKI